MKSKYTIDGLNHYEVYLRTTPSIDSCEIASVQVHPPHLRGKGYGTALLRQCCKDADREMVVLTLFVAADESGMSNEDLFSWYTRHGFVPVSPGSGNMKRYPILIK